MPVATSHPPCLFASHHPKQQQQQQQRREQQLSGQQGAGTASQTSSLPSRIRLHHGRRESLAFRFIRRTVFSVQLTCPAWHTQGIDFDSLAGPSGGTGADYYDLEEDATNSALIAELDRKKASRKLALPTNDLEVRRRLRGLGHPITLFGEKREDRRERLRDVIVRQRQAQGLDIDMDSGSDSDESGEDGEGKEEEEKEEEFYTEGDEDLARARRWMAAYSLPRAKRRVARQKAEATLPLTRILEARKGVFAELKVRPTCPAQLAHRELMLRAPFRRATRLSARSSQTSGPYAQSGSAQIRSTYYLARGRGL